MAGESCSDGGYCHRCRPTWFQPRVSSEGRALLVSMVHPGGTVVASATGTLNGRKVRCKVVARARAGKNPLAKRQAVLRIPTGLKGKVYAHCEECEKTTRGFPVDTRT